MVATYGIAVRDNAVANFATFGGLAVDAHSLLVAQELKGDANADGKIDITDPSTVLNNFGGTATLWPKGNFHGSATIDRTHLSNMLKNFGATNPSPSFAPGSAQQFAVGTPSTATPDPTSLAVLVSRAALLLTRRRTLRKA